jgi:hypothetical protein
MIYGISGAPIPETLPYASPVTAACLQDDMPPCLLYAIAWRESISGEVNGEWPNAALVVAGDGGHGLCQLTSSWPNDWANPIANVEYAITEFVQPAIHYWHGLQGYSGDTLVLLVAATYNEGLGAAEKYHASGDVDAGTTDEYGHGVLDNFTKLVAGLAP